MSLRKEPPWNEIDPKDIAPSFIFVYEPKPFEDNDGMNIIVYNVPLESKYLPRCLAYFQDYNVALDYVERVVAPYYIVDIKEEWADIELEKQNDRLDNYGRLD